MDMSEDLDSLNESSRDRRSMGMTLLLVAVFASLFMVLFLYSPVLWAVLCAVAFAVATGFIITTILLGVREQRRALDDLTAGRSRPPGRALVRLQGPTGPVCSRGQTPAAGIRGASTPGAPAAKCVVPD